MMLRTVRNAGWALALLGAGVSAAAQPVDDLERADSTALSISWRMQLANAAYCARTAPATGIQLQDTAVFDDAALVRSTYGLSGDIFVGALAADGPGAAAGLSVNATIIAIDGQPVDALPPPPQRAVFDRLKQVQALLDNAAARGGVVSLTIAGGHDLHVTPRIACHVAIVVDDGKNYARAIRDEIHLGRRRIDETAGDDGLLAAMIAHEMAHAVLDHQATLAADHGSVAATRRTEREADRLSVWLLANAGYLPDVAVTFQRTIIARHNGFMTIDPTHGGWRKRAQIITAEIMVMKSVADSDWARHFRREGE